MYDACVSIASRCDGMFAQVVLAVPNVTTASPELISSATEALGVRYVSALRCNLRNNFL